MHPVMWHKKKLFIILGISFIAYLMLKNKKYYFEDEVVLMNTKAEIVWEFIADFSNVKKHLVPHMYNFSVTAESGNYDHWKYSVAYEEILPVWPYLHSTGIGHYSVTVNGDIHKISSTHITCLFRGWSCYESVNEFYIKPVNNKKDTKYREEVIYECPPLFSYWCSHVADYTRKDFIKNLMRHFKSSYRV